MKKGIIIGVVVLTLVVGIIGFFAASDLKKENLLNNEVKEVIDLINQEEIDENLINKKLDENIMNGKYNEVERAFKDFVHDYLYDLNIIKILDILNDETIVNVLSVDNYKKDGKDFKETKNYLQTTISFLENSKVKYENYFNDKKIMSYLNSDLEQYYKDLYKNEYIQQLKMINNEESFKSSVDEILNILKIDNEIINLLSTNQNSWFIEKDNIVFQSQSLLDDYNALINKFKTN